ncbi:MAG: chemotaxis protein CheW [Desulfuromonas sp.]|nr:chemotaxis protein CheW [Desulfuromonas sp.]
MTEVATKPNLSDNEVKNEDTQEGKYLTFHMGDEDYGIQIRFVTEIIGIQRITEVPDMPPFIKGVINLRGKVIPVMDVRARFNLPAREYDERTCIIVVQLNTTSVGLVVDKVNEVADIQPENIEPPPRSTAGGSSEYIEGMGKMGDRVKILLNISKLLYDSDLEQIDI